MDEEKERALESVKSRQGEYSEVMICDSEGFYAIGRLLFDKFSLMLYSTQADEFAALKDMQKNGVKIEDAINRLLKEKPVNKA